MKPPKKRPPSQRAEHQWSLPPSLSKSLRDVFEEPEVRRAFVAVDVLMATDGDRCEIFSGRNAYLRAAAAGHDVESLMLLPIDFSNPVDVVFLEKACLIFRGSLSRGTTPDRVNPLTN